jgi:hypothetical protein
MNGLMTALPLDKLTFEQLDASLQAMLRPIADRLGYFGEMLQYLGHAPKSLAGFTTFGRELRHEIPDNLNEVAALTICTRLDFAYERIQHERLSERLGLPRQWIAALIERADLSVLSDVERTARSFALAVVDQRHDNAREELGRLVGAVGPCCAVALLLQIVRFMSVCIIGSILQPALPVPSIFEESRVEK